MKDKYKLEKHDWKEEYSVGIESIDEQHKKFVEILNLLIDVINGGECSDRITDVFFSLAYYAEHYFINEEIMFMDYKYPNLTQHKELHNEFILKITLFQKGFENNKNDVCRDLYAYLEAWFKEHILDYDIKASNFLKEHGV
jgi:hemerythrin-like metal-binding protein